MAGGSTTLVLLWVATLAAGVGWPSATDSPTVGDDLIRFTIRLALALYFAAAWRMLGGARARTCWTLAWAAYVIHVGVAFHFDHGWSHADAMRHSRDRSGVAEGIFVSYAFTLLWTADVAWWWLRPAAHAARPAWVGRLLHGFMAFIIFNGAVVYADGPVRWAGLALFAALAVRWRRVRAAPANELRKGVLV